MAWCVRAFSLLSVADQQGLADLELRTVPALPRASCRIAGEAPGPFMQQLQHSALPL